MPTSPKRSKRLLGQTAIIVRAETDKIAPASQTSRPARIRQRGKPARAAGRRRKSLPRKRQCHSFLTPFVLSLGLHSGTFQRYFVSL